MERGEVQWILFGGGGDGDWRVGRNGWNLKEWDKM